MYQAFCDQKGKVPYIPMSHPYENNQKHSMYKALGLVLVKPDSVSKTHSSGKGLLLFHSSSFLLFHFPSIFFFFFVVCFKRKALK